MKYHNLLMRFLILLFTVLWFKIGLVDAGWFGGGNKPPLDPRETLKYTVSVQANNTHVAAGCITSKFHVVTAASYFLDANSKFVNVTYKIVAGVIQLIDKKYRQESLVLKIYLPRKFGANSMFASKKKRKAGPDIAVLKLERALKLGKSYVPMMLQLPTANAMIAPGLVVTGFGLTAQGFSSNPSATSALACTQCAVMKYSTVTPVYLEDCQRMYNTQIPKNQFCARVDNLLGLCKGDIGNPLVASGTVLIGIYIRGPPDCNERQVSGLYTKVSAVLPFINNAMKDAKTRDIRSAHYIIRKKWFSANLRILIED